MTKMLEKKFAPNVVAIREQEAAAFRAAADTLDDGGGVPIVKLNKAGDAWCYGPESESLVERIFAADIANAEHGWICLKDHKVVDRLMTPMVKGPPAPKEALPQHGPYTSDRDGWKEVATLQLRSIESGEQYLYAPTSKGGLAAIGGLARQYSYRLSGGKAGVPIVELGVSSYEHREHGRTAIPLLRIVEWRDAERLTVSTPLADELDDAIPF